MDELISRQVLDLWDRYKPTIAVDAIEYDRELKQLLSTNLAEVGMGRMVNGFPIDADDLMLRVEEKYGFRSRDRLYDIIRKMPKYELASIHPEPHWIPCSERLPEKEGYYLITKECLGFVGVDTRYYYTERDSGYWSLYENGTVIAWMPLPEPYKGVTT